MKYLKLLRIAVILIAVGLFVFLILYSREMMIGINGFFQQTRVGIYSRLSLIGSFVSEVKKVKDLTGENIKLREENQNLLARLAYQENLKEENEFLRQSLDLLVVPEYRSLDAGVFNMHFTPQSHYLLVNKGRVEGVNKNDVVISSSGVLIGRINEVFENYSRVSTVVSRDFKTTIKVISKDISGIAEGAMEDGMYLDFISQNDEINEGDTITTSGNDIFPAGLIVGNVVKINEDSGGLFKNVKVEPILKRMNLSRVLILGKY